MYNNGYYGGYSVYPAWPNPQNGAMPDQLAQYKQPYQLPQQPQMMQQAPQMSAQQNNGIVWVQGEAGAKAHLVAPGQSMMLMDSEGMRFYIKVSDASGMPMPLRVFEYHEVTGAQQTTEPVPQIDPKQFVTREEFEKAISMLTPKGEDVNG